MNDLTAINQTLTTTNGRLDENPAAVYLAGLSIGSRRTMSHALATIAEIVTGDDEADPLALQWEKMRFQHTAAIRSELAERYAHTTANKMLSALRGVLKAAWRLGLIESDEYAKATAVENVKGERVPSGRALGIGEVTAIMQACDDSAVGVRDTAVIALMYYGLRRAEIVALDMDDYNPETKMLIVQGKRNKQRELPIANGAVANLTDWLNIRGDDPGPLFIGLNHTNDGGRLTTQAIYDMLQRRAEAAKVRAVSPHDFRRTFASELLDRGADIVTVQKLMGHANVTTTARYDRRGEAAKRRAAEMLHVPYTR